MTASTTPATADQLDLLASQVLTFARSNTGPS
jgi:hypothetical protein